jgi:hypothetical protein
MKTVILRVTILGAAIISLPGAFEYEAVSPSALFPCRQAVIDADAPDQALYGAYAPFSPGPVFSLSACRPYSMPELLAGGISMACPMRPLALSASWITFGMEGYRENRVRAALGWAAVKGLSLSAGGGWYNLDVRGGELNYSENRFQPELDFLFRPLEWIEGGICLRDAASLFKDPRHDRDPGLGWGLALKPARGLSITYNINRDAWGYSSIFSINAHILPFCSIHCGYGRETLTWSAAVVFLCGHVSFSYGIRMHPYLGATHVVGLACRYGDEAAPVMGYYGRSYPGYAPPDPSEKIDVRDCVQEDLEAIPGISEVMAWRMIRYRESVGPLSEKALVQIGISAPEAEAMKDYIYGLAPDDGKEEAASEKRPSPVRGPLNHALRKKLFMALVEEARISPVEAMALCEKARSGNREALKKFISEREALGAEEKGRAAAVCERYLR